MINSKRHQHVLRCVPAMSRLVAVSRYRGTRKNLFDQRRAAIVHNASTSSPRQSAGNYHLAA